VVFYLRWKSQKLERQLQYDCKTCLVNGRIKKQGRVCFLEKSEHNVLFPVFNLEENGKKLPVPRRAVENGNLVSESRKVTKKDIFIWLEKMELLFPSMPAFEVLMAYLKPICIESLLDTNIMQWFRLEAAVKAYGTGALDLPVNIFNKFESIRSAENIFENLENFKREQEAKKHG